MVENKINSYSISALVYFLIRGSFLGMGIYNIFQISSTNTAMSSVIGAIIGYIPLLIFLYIMKKGNGKNIFDINKSLFGKVFGNILNMILSILFFAFGMIIYYNLISFLDLQYMPETSRIYVKVLLLIALVYCLSKGIESITRSAQIFLIITIVIYIITAIGLIDKIEISNIYPIYDGSNIKILISSCMYAIFSSMPIFLLGCVGRGQIKDDNNYSKNIIKIFTFSNIMLVIMIIFLILVLGYPLISILKYPEYMVAKKVVLFNIFERLENTMAFQWIFDSFFLILMTLYFTYKNFESYSNNKIYKKAMVYLLPIISFFVTGLLFKNIVESTELNIKYTPYILSCGVGIIVLLMVFKILYNKFKKTKTINET